jgi:capsular exopolysaccharide synthesis family protein
MEYGRSHQLDSVSQALDTKLVKKASSGFLPQLFKAPSEMHEGHIHEGLIDVQRIVENVHLIAKDKGVQVIGIASAVSNEGSSTLATVISLIMAESSSAPVASFAIDNQEQYSKPHSLKPRQHEILLIDAQWRNPSLHNFLGMPLERGLGELLSDEILPRDAIRSIAASGLKLITTGRKSWNPLAPINIEKLKSLLNELKPYFKFVVLDLPPVIRFAEAVTLSKQCDGLILVVRANQTRWEIVAEAKRLLERSGVNILGAVLNRRKFYVPEVVYRKL